MNYICEYFRKNPGSVVLWLAYSEELCEQAIGEFMRSWRSLGNQPTRVLRHFGSHTAPNEISGNTFLVSGLAKMVHAMKNSNDLFNLLMGDLKLIIMDEAHQAIAPSYREILEKLSLRGAHILGLTATPGRSYEDQDANRELAHFFHNQKIELRVEGYDSAVDYLIENRYLSRTEFFEIEGAKEGILTDKDVRSVQASMDIPNDVLKKLAFDEFRNLSIIRKIRELTEKHLRIIYFAPSLDNAEHIAFVLKMLSVNSYLVSSKKERRSRTEVIKKFLSEDPEPMVVCNFGILTTGFDAPKTSCVVIGRPTRSLVLYSQMAGRAIRGPKAGGNEKAEVYTVMDTSLKGFGTIQDAFIHWNEFYNHKEVSP
jgi:DNA repair protein RadD